MMAVFAELERNIICARVKSGLVNAKAKGKVLGRRTTTADDITPLFYKYYPKYKNNEITKVELAKLSELSYPTIYKYLNIIEKINIK